MCKLEYYGNCDPKTKDQEYCVFHRSNESEEEAREFWMKFLERFKPKKEKIYDEQSRKEIQRFIFEEEVNCRGYVFPEIPKDLSFSFYQTIFKRCVDFVMATFKGADFEGVTFEKNVNFKFVTFEGVAEFSNVIFKGEADFGFSTIKGDAYFIGATFEKGAYFSGTTFNGRVNFENATFKGYSNFEKSTLKKM